ncbi:MAG: glycosyltransferase family 9 protein [Massilia sp.]
MSGAAVQGSTDHVQGAVALAPPFGRVMLAKPSHLGDLIISLPMAAALKRRDPGCTVVFLTSAGTAEVARCCPAVDEVLAIPTNGATLPALLASLDLQAFVQVNSWPLLAAAAHRARVPVRIGSMYRLYNWVRCTHLVSIARAARCLNKRELDLQLLAPFGVSVPDHDTIAADGRLHPPDWGAHASASLLPRQLARGRRSIVLSAASVTAASHCWPWQAYVSLLERLGSGYHWSICGVAADREQLQPLLRSLDAAPNVTDLVGKLSLRDFMCFVAASDGLIGGSSGPVHLAAALGVRTLGLYQSRPADVHRWRPLGEHTAVLHSHVPCQGERRSKRAPQTCPCIAAIDTADVAAHVSNWFAEARAGPAVTVAGAGAAAMNTAGTRHGIGGHTQGAM